MAYIIAAIVTNLSVLEGHSPLLGTNLIRDFTAVTFSVKLAFFREIHEFS